MFDDGGNQFFKLSPHRSDVCISNYSYIANGKTFSYLSNKTTVHYGIVEVLKKGIFASKGHTLEISGLELNVYAYQPNHPWFNNYAEDTLPVAEICWRYKGDETKHYICQLGKEKGYKDGVNADGSNVDNSKKYKITCDITSNNDKANFECVDAKNVTFTSDTLEKNEIEIIAVIQWASYAKKRKTSQVNFNFSSFNVSLKNNTCLLIDNASLINIDPSGLTITATDGGKLMTNGEPYIYANTNYDGGALTLSSANNKYALMITDVGIFLRKGSAEWVKM